MGGAGAVVRFGNRGLIYWHSWLEVSFHQATAKAFARITEHISAKT
jgi:hypothetical protein